MFGCQSTIPTTRQTPPARRDPPLTPHLSERIERDFWVRYREQWGGRFILHGRPRATEPIRLDGNDYLGLTGHPKIANAIMNAVRREAGFAIQSGAFLLDAHPARAFEKLIAQWVGKSDGMLCQSGYAANIGLLQAIADESTPVYIDGLAHMSLWQGAQAARAPARPFRHNDPDHLDRLIALGGPGLVVVDSVYSTTGALCRLTEIIEVVERHGSMILVDESHSLGTHGPQGAGLCAALGLADQVHFITASLAKAFAGRAGFFTVPANLRTYFLTESYPNIFSSCLLPHEIAGLATTLDVVRGAEFERARLWTNVRRLRNGAAEMGYPIEGSEQIVVLEAGSEPSVIELRDALEERGVYGAIFCAPATSRNRAMVRMTVSAALTDTEIDRTIEVLREIAPLVRPWQWPIARRASARGSAQTTVV